MKTLPVTLHLEKVVDNVDENPRVKFGYFIALEHYEVNSAIEQAVYAEKSGFESIWISDHFHPWSANGQSAMAWPVIAAIAERTEKATPISTCVTCPTIRYNPAIVAQAFATLGKIYPYRIGLGIGSGEAMNEFPPTGKWPSAKERLEMLVESVKVIRTLWDADKPVSFRGRYYRLVKARLYTKAKWKIPLYFSASGVKACELAGMYGDHWITTSANPDYLKEVTVPAFTKGAKKAQKDPTSMERVIVLDFSVDNDLGKAEESCRPFAASLIPAIFRYGVFDPEEIEENGRVVGIETMKRNWIITSSTDEIIDRLEQYVRAGINHFSLLNLSPNVKWATKLIGEKIIPYFNS